MTLCPSDNKPCECQPDAFEYCRDDGVAFIQAAYEREIKKQEGKIDRLRGQLQNCVNHLNRAKRKSYGKQSKSFDDCIDRANKALYETLIG